MSYIAGNIIRLTATFRDSAGAAVDPTAVEFRVVAPGAAVSVVAGTRASSGEWFADVTAATPGKWAFRAVASGAVVAAAEGSFQVLPYSANFNS